MIDKLERERDFYRQQCNDLGARIMQLQHEQVRIRREARRSRTTARLIRELYRLADSRIQLDQIGRQFLRIVVDALHIDRAALLKYAQEPARFVAVGTLGFPPVESLSFALADWPPEFLFANSSSAAEPGLNDLRQVVGLPYLLWSFHPRSGYALLVGNGTEDQQFHRPFEASNRELVEAALQVYIELDERKRTEEALRVSEEKHRLVVENANEAIVVAQDGHIKFFNSKLMEFTTGYLPEELIHTPFTAFIHPEDRPMVMERHLKRLKGEVCPQVYTFRILDKGGRVTWVEINAIRINWEEKPAILFFLSDISERKQAQDRLAESEQRYRQLVKHAPAGIYQIDYVSSRFIDVNDVMCEYTGYSKDEFLALSVLDILTEESKKQFVDRAKKVQAGEPIPETAEFKVKAKNGSEFWVLVNTRVNYEHEQPVSATVIAHNISERRQAEAELEKYRLHLEELVNERTVELTAVNGQLQLEIAERERAEVQIKASLKEKEVLLREIHHRVKNNLQVISSLLNLHSSHLKDQQLQAILQDSQHRVRSMALIHQKLYQSASLAQIDFGEYMLELATYLFRAQDAHARGISLNIRADNIFFDIDKAMPCGLIVNELVSNSLKHAFPSGRPGQICLELHSGPEYLVTLTVADNGVGFPPGLDFRDTESLGLQLVNSLVNQLDGCVELRSEAGVHFTITFGHIRTELSPNQGEA